LKYCCQEFAALVGECVHDHLPVAPRADQAMGSKRAGVMRDKVLSALDDPSEIADTQFVGPQEGSPDG